RECCEPCCQTLRAPESYTCRSPVRRSSPRDASPLGRTCWSWRIANAKSWLLGHSLLALPLKGGGPPQSSARSSRSRRWSYDASFCEASAAILRSSNRCSFPVWVRGRLVTYSIARGYLYGATVTLT